MPNSSSFGLPSINNLDVVKREEMDRHRSYSYSAAPQSAQSAVPPVPGSLGGLLSPPDSRRTSEKDDERESQRPRQSLPSIHELTFAAPPAVPPPSVPVSQSYYPPPPPPPPTSTTASPVEHRTRAYSTDVHASHGPGNPFGHPRSPYQNPPNSTVPPPPPPPPPLAQPEPLPRASASFSEARPSFSASQPNPKLPVLHSLQTAQSPTTGPAPANPPYSSSYSVQPSTTYDTSNPHSAGPISHGYGYQYPSPGHPLSAPAPNAPNPAYPPTYSAPPRAYPNPPTWPENRVEEKKMNRTSLAPYGESVKRHLESFDLEASLNEMAQGSAQIAEFSKYYRQQAHETQRIGMTAQSMPRLEEVDEMLKSSEKIQVSLHRMREVIFNHQQASIIEAPKDPRHRPMNGYDHETQSNYGDDVKGAGGFAGPDSKKRRGRAAPPGRCHSCNRAETPEWRRGPDGARTLCNACGLHYAKLTRKMGGGKQAMAMAGNLRPKNLEHGPPAG